MRKIQRISKPAELTEAVQNELTKEFKTNNKAVWNKIYIREALLKMTSAKCCYCETKLGPGYKELHVDHFHPKSSYPNEVVEWNNLLPACPHCNKCKSDHDTYKEPIINPCEEDPRYYFYFKDYRYKSKDTSPDSVGKRTLLTLNLNDTEEIKNTRFKLGEALNSEIEKIYELAYDNRETLNANTRIRNRVLNGCKNIMKFCQPDSEYGSCMATILHSNAEFKRLCDIITQFGLWNEELENLYILSNEIKYE